ncbi:hypothetical protein OUZ56_004609 [Daphnia magna]|uniref:Secreted protein n=1 Tax=Daphnia magna TaxID=35525 RepID=A0ABQ9YQA6_9CRUS|nr:hypothetical protein OUZ56_004609 [Daphnia magna]
MWYDDVLLLLLKTCCCRRCGRRRSTQLPLPSIALALRAVAVRHFKRSGNRSPIVLFVFCLHDKCFERELVMRFEKVDVVVLYFGQRKKNGDDVAHRTHKTKVAASSNVLQEDPLSAKQCLAH